MDQVVPPGRWSEAVTSEALPVPLLVSETVHPTWSPAETESASAILAMDTFPQFTAMSGWAPPEPSFEVVKVAALCRLVHSVLSVVVMSCLSLHDALPILAGP